jgi:hypothetical protein
VILAAGIIGEDAMAGIGAILTHDVPTYAFVVCLPGRVIAWVCKCGSRLKKVVPRSAPIATVSFLGKGTVCPKHSQPVVLHPDSIL